MKNLEEGLNSEEEFQTTLGEAVLLAVKLQELDNIDVVTDGCHEFACL